MFHNRTLNNKINKSHKRALRRVYTDENLTFQEVLDKDNSVTIHHKNLTFQEVLDKDNSVTIHHKNLTFQEVLDKDNSVTIHHKNLTFQDIPGSIGQRQLCDNTP